MTLEQLEQRVHVLEQEIAQLRLQQQPLRPLPNVAQTFGMFADDPEFDEVLRLGREFRAQANAKKG
jgi:hypothetical protein